MLTLGDPVPNQSFMPKTAIIRKQKQIQLSSFSSSKMLSLGFIGLSFPSHFSSVCYVVPCKIRSMAWKTYPDTAVAESVRAIGCIRNARNLLTGYALSAPIHIITTTTAIAAFLFFQALTKHASETTVRSTHPCQHSPQPYANIAQHCCHDRPQPLAVYEGDQEEEQLLPHEKHKVQKYLSNLFTQSQCEMLQIHAK